MLKQCFRCKTTKDTSEFHKYSRNPDGLQPYMPPLQKSD